MKINSVDQPLSTQTPARGAASVGELAELDETMQVFVLYMRRWTASVEGREGVWHDAAERYGKAGSQRVIGALEIFLTVVANHATRPLQRHGNSCQCLGQDEAILAALISGAGRQDGPLLRMLSMEFVAPAGFTETVGAAAQLHDALTTSMPFVAAGGDARVLH